MIINKIFCSGQTIDLATGETYTLKTDEVFINENIYKKKDLEITTQNIFANNNPEMVKVGIRKRDGIMNLPATFVKFNEWEHNGNVFTSLSDCVESITNCIYFSNNSEKELDFKNTTDVTSEPLDGIYNQTVDVVGTGTIANPQYPIREYKIIDGVITVLSSGSGSDDQTASEVPFTAVSPRIGRDNTQDAIEKVESNLDEIASSTLMAFSTPLTNASPADPKLPDFNTTTNTFTLFRDTIMHYRNQRFVLPADTSIVMSNNSSTHKVYFNVVTKELFTIPWNALLTASQVVNMQLVAVTRKLGDTATLNITSPYTINRDLSANFDNVVLNGIHAGVKGIAHRGASITAPENTISAYQLASDLGFSWWETDVAFTSDGIPVLMHDDTIDRTSNGSGLVSSMTLAELQAFDYGSWKSSTYAGEQILTFEGLLKLAVKLNSHIFVEPKGVPTATERQTMLDLIKSTGMTGRINMISFDLGTLQNFRDEDPTLELGFLGGNPNLISRALTLKTPTNTVSVIVAPNVLTQALSDEVHNAGMSIYQYTLNTEAEVVTHADLGGDGVITDIVNVAKALGAKSQGGSRNYASFSNEEILHSLYTTSVPNPFLELELYDKKGRYTILGLTNITYIDRQGNISSLYELVLNMSKGGSPNYLYLDVEPYKFLTENGDRVVKQTITIDFIKEFKEISRVLTIKANGSYVASEWGNIIFREIKDTGGLTYIQNYKHGSYYIKPASNLQNYMYSTTNIGDLVSDFNGDNQLGVLYIIEKNAINGILYIKISLTFHSNGKSITIQKDIVDGFSTDWYLLSGESAKEVNTSRELNNTDNNSILIVTASSTLTIPLGLVNGFNCAIYTKTGILTNATVTGITEFPITAGSTLQENRSQVIMQDPTDPTNYIITGDNE